MANGFCIVHGGGTTGRDATGTFLRRVGSFDAPLVVLGQSSETPVEKGRSSADWLRENGATNVYVATVTETDASGLPELLEKLETARGFWMPGGDQNRLTRIFAKTAVPDALRRILQRGGSGGGSSAGASLCGEWMPTGEEDRTKLVKNSVGTAPGLNLLPNFLVDTHFLARERTQRSVNMVLSRPGLAALCVDQDGWFEADLARRVLTVGAGQVVTLRAAAPVRADSAGRLACTDIRMRVLLPGDSLRFEEILRK